MLLVLSLPHPSFAAGWQWMTPQRVNDLIQEGSGLWIIDVRSDAAFSEGHMEGAVHIPAGVLATKRLPKGKIFVIADDGLGLRKGREAAEALLKSGQEKVFLLKGGIPGWQADGYPLVGKGRGTFRSVMPEEIKWAQENSIPLRIFDLRDQTERSRGVVEKVVVVEGADIPARLESLKAILVSQKNGLAARLEETATIILVFPTGADPRVMLERTFREIPGDVRFLEGGFAAWAAKPDKSLTTRGTCSTCSGGGSK